MKPFPFIVFLLFLGNTLLTAQSPVHDSGYVTNDIETYVYTYDFNTSQGAAFTTSGEIGTSGWMVNRFGADWGARIHNDILELTNDAGATANANGWVFAYIESDNFDAPYQTTLNGNTNLLSWSFNMRQIRDNPAGFGATSYGVAFVIGSTSINVKTEGDGYAVVLGNSLTPDPVRFVKFSSGLSSLETQYNYDLITAPSPLNNPTNNYMSIQLTYDPETDTWELFGR